MEATTEQALLNIHPDVYFKQMGEGFERGGRIRMYFLMAMLRQRKEERGF